MNEISGSKFVFTIDFVTPNEKINLLTRDMQYPYKNEGKSFKNGIPVQSDNVVQHSVESTQIAQSINSLVRSILKDSTMDYMEKYQYSGVELKPYDTTDCFYKITLVDTNYPVYLSNGHRLMNITIFNKKTGEVLQGNNNPDSNACISNLKLFSDTTLFKVTKEFAEQSLTIFSSTIDARDYIYNPNFTPPFNKIWKDFYHINDPNPNSELKEDGVTKRTMTLGIRSLIKNLLNTNKFTNRFTTPIFIPNTHCGYVNSN